MVQTVQIELSMLTFNAYVTGHLRDMFYDSKTQLIQFTDWQSGWKSPLNNLQSRWKKRKEYQRVENELSIKGNIKASNINLAWISIHVRKEFLNLLTQLIQSTDQQT